MCTKEGTECIESGYKTKSIVLEVPDKIPYASTAAELQNVTSVYIITEWIARRHQISDELEN